MNISEPFIQRPVATSLLMAAIGFVGLVAVPFLPVAPLPQVDFPTISVSATLQGASAETMAASVAAPLERQFGQIPGVTQLTSVSALNSTSITIQFELNHNIDSAGQDVQAAITVASKTLPRELSVPPSYKKVNPARRKILAERPSDAEVAKLAQFRQLITKRWDKFFTMGDPPDYEPGPEMSVAAIATRTGRTPRRGGLRLHH
jgi:multidrug efflux pump subunit AcrB